VTTLGVSFAGVALQNPVVLASGTAAYGRELHDIVDLERLGGLVTKAVSLAPRPGARAPRVSDFPGGMINAIGLANPGVDVVRETELPWLAAHLHNARVFVNVVGNAVEDFGEVITRLGPADGVSGFELNVSCPNVKAGGMEFGADRGVLRTLIERARAATTRPLVIKLSPTLPDLAGTAQVCADTGADAITLTNTLPGLVIDVEQRRPRIGFGSGGVSGPPLLPVGVLATWRVSRVVSLPIIGLGGVSRGEHALQYIMAGATLVGVGTAGMVDPRAPERIVRELEEWCRRHGVSSLSSLRGCLEWPS
jgi:dihydroorotate dehydrogenase (NAD+) catalytic subunit